MKIKKALKSAFAIYIQKSGGLVYLLTNKGLDLAHPIPVVLKRYYEFGKLRVVFVNGVAVEGEVVPYETYFVMKDYVILT